MIIGLLIIIAVALIIIGRQNQGRFIFEAQMTGLDVSNQIGMESINYIFCKKGTKPENIDWDIYQLLVLYSALYKQKRYGNLDIGQIAIVKGSIEKMLKVDIIWEHCIKMDLVNHPLWDKGFRKLAKKLLKEIGSKQDEAT